MRKHWTFLVGSGLVILLALALVGAQSGGGTPQPAATGTPIPGNQPIWYSHLTHAGTYQMDCQYCHFSAERSVDAGIPPVASCMGCHTVIPGNNRPGEVDKIRDYYNRGESIPWVRIHKVSDHVKFPHMRHVAAEITCQECHGQVQEKDEPWSELPPEAEGLKMGWCISCHLDNEASRDCTVCHY